MRYPSTIDSVGSRPFWLLAFSDLVHRSAYQMGKTPLLPLFAASLGATDILLGLVVAVSTLTGMVFKPFVGVLSDRWGRRVWLFTGTAFFALVPFLYRFAETPEHLVILRIVHGSATAIYGPVTLAYIAELAAEGRAERVGWFAMAKNAGYVIGPVLGGWMLLVMDPVSVFTVIGLASTLMFVPVVLLPETTSASPRRLPLLREAVGRLWSGGKTPAVWLSGGMDGHLLVAEYALKAFLPVYAVSHGASPALVGAYFSIQEGTTMFLTPLGGRLADRIGYLPAVALGMTAMGLGLSLLVAGDVGPLLVVPATTIGTAQAIVHPATVALIARSVSRSSGVATGMGLAGTLENGAKVIGPILGGAMVHAMGFTSTFALMGVALLAAAAIVSVIHLRSGQPERRPASF